MLATSEAPEVSPARTWTIPRPDDSAAQVVRRLARQVHALADDVEEAGHTAARLVERTQPAWCGPGADAAREPVLALEHDCRTVARALRDAGHALDRYAAALEEAAHRSHSSWRTALTVGAVVAVTAAAVTVTVASAGTATAGAAVAEAAVLEAAAAEAAAAGASAGSAGSAAATALAAAARAVQAVLALRAIVVPRLVLATLRAPAWLETPAGSATVGGTTAAAADYADDGRVHVSDVALSAALGAGEVLGSTPRRRFLAHPAERWEDVSHLTDPGVRALLQRVARGSADQGRRPFSATARQLQSHYRHAGVLDLPENYNPRNAVLYGERLQSFTEAPSTVVIDGIYRHQPALLYADYDRRIVLICSPEGQFVTVLSLNPGQFFNLWHHGRI